MILVVSLPILPIQRVKGKVVRPMAVPVTIALLGHCPVTVGLNGFAPERSGLSGGTSPPDTTDRTGNVLITE